MTTFCSESAALNRTFPSCAILLWRETTATHRQFDGIIASLRNLRAAMPAIGDNPDRSCSVMRFRAKGTTMAARDDLAERASPAVSDPAGHPPVSARCIDHVNLSVRDLDASIKFYCDLLGVEVKEGGESQGIRWTILGTKDRFYFCFFEVKDGVFRPGDIHINHIGLVVDDLDETIKRIHDLGLRLQFGDKAVQWPRSRSAYVVDPDGISIEFTERFGGGLD
jgi:lactoylglutathione lyase